MAGMNLPDLFDHLGTHHGHGFAIDTPAPTVETIHAYLHSQGQAEITHVHSGGESRPLADRVDHPDDTVRGQLSWAVRLLEGVDTTTIRGNIEGAVAVRQALWHALRAEALTVLGEPTRPAQPAHGADLRELAYAALTEWDAEDQPTGDQVDAIIEATRPAPAQPAHGPAYRYTEPAYLDLDERAAIRAALTQVRGVYPADWVEAIRHKMLPLPANGEHLFSLSPALYDNVWLGCSCGWGVDLGTEATLTAALNARAAHLADPDARPAGPPPDPLIPAELADYAAAIGHPAVEPWCNHDPVAVRAGVCECGATVVQHDERPDLDLHDEARARNETEGYER